MNTSYKDIDLKSWIDLGEITSRKVEGEIETVNFHLQFESPFLNTFEELTFLVSIKNGEFLLDEQDNIKIINANFKVDSNDLEEAQMQYVVNSTMSRCGVRDDDWNDADYLRILSGIWRGRTIFEYNVFIELDEEENFVLTIVNMNDFLAKTAST